MSFYEPYTPNLARRQSFHSSAPSDIYHRGSYDDSYLPRQSYGEVNRPLPALMSSKRGESDTQISRQPYQQYPSQIPFPAYGPPPPLGHQPFSVPREHQSFDFYSPHGDPHGFIPSPEPLSTLPDMTRYNSVNGNRRSWNPTVDSRDPTLHPHASRSFTGTRSESPSPPPMPLPELGPPNLDVPNLRRTQSRGGVELPGVPPMRRTKSRGGVEPGMRRTQSRGGYDHSFPTDGIPLPTGVGLTAVPLATHESDRTPSFRPTPAYADSFEDSPLQEPAYFDGMERGRTLSTGYHNAPLVAPPLGSYSSKHYRSRRASTPGPYTTVPIPMGGAMSVMDTTYMQRTGANILFRLKGGYTEGISLADATADARLSRSVQYAFHQLHLGPRGRLLVRVRWQGYRPFNYEIPVTGLDGFANGITIPWDRVLLHRLEEETDPSAGVYLYH
ncbi:hypothetical protein K488DRAFT_68209 [Vararia minispora EC-137]|uniref:Uncharacterized protein n=1 Tax=Vararia minispora EC-137 TaxID=1314806 RepID=A0ACB8QUU6_9AGAM|nr:hypothetical protein K488DRAFT_68209 [Vararia minispora EC-137]